MSEIHHTILRRLVVSWLLISIVIGLVVAFYGIRKIDEQMIDLAMRESTRLNQDSIGVLAESKAQHAPAAESLEKFLKERFVVVTIFDSAQHPIVKLVNPQHVALENELERLATPLPKDAHRHHQRYSLDSGAAIRILMPLKANSGAVSGYFEGVFLIDPATSARLKEDLLASLLIALAAVALTTLVLYPVILSLNRSIIRQSKELLKGNIELMEVLGSAIAKRDSDTNIHNYRVAIYSVKLAEQCNFRADAIRDLIAGAFLHDVGKIGISDTILLKPGRLTPEEFTVMKTHVAMGVEILKKSSWLERARNVVEFHHEKFDGSGYPRGLKGKEIPTSARIFSIVDVFDALSSNRPYKASFSFEDAIEILQQNGGSHFDPKLVRLFEKIARPLHTEVSNATQEIVESRLHELIFHYFFDDGQSMPENKPNQMESTMSQAA